MFAGGDARIRAVAKSCQAKADVVKADERESGRRALLNLGHTFGHALEACAGYDPDILVHGEGVSIGMVMAHEFSSRLNHCGPEVAEKLEAHLKNVGLPTRVQDIASKDGDNPFSLDAMMAAIAQDKKVVRGDLTFILSSGVGQAFVEKQVPSSLVEAYLGDVLA